MREQVQNCHCRFLLRIDQCRHHSGLFQLPIHAIGIGEGIDDLQPFDPEEFTIALTGVEDL